MLLKSSENRSTMRPISAINKHPGLLQFGIKSVKTLNLNGTTFAVSPAKLSKDKISNSLYSTVNSFKKRFNNTLEKVPS